MQSLDLAFWLPHGPDALDRKDGCQDAAGAFEHLRRLANVAEDRGFRYAFAPARGWTGQFAPFDALTLVSALASVTRHIRLVASIRPYLRHPRITAKALHSLAVISGGRAGVNVLTAAAREDFTSYGELLDFEEQFRLAERFIQTLREVWRDEAPSFHDNSFDGPPLPIFLTGHSDIARALVARSGDWYLIEGDKPEIVARQIAQIRQSAAQADRDPDTLRFAVNALVVMRDNERDAQLEVRSALGWSLEQTVIRSRATQELRPALEVVPAHDAGADQWQPTSGLKTGLIGSEDHVLERLSALQEAGIHLVLCNFLRPYQDIPTFGERVLQTRNAQAQPLPRSLDPALRQALGLGG